MVGPYGLGFPLGLRLCNYIYPDLWPELGGGGEAVTIFIVFLVIVLIVTCTHPSDWGIK